LCGKWKSWTNREQEEISKGENIVKWINGQRASWLDHLERMEEDRMPKRILTQELKGTRRSGRPRKRWKEEVERDLQVLGVRRWRELVADRKKMEGHCSTGQSPQWAVVPVEQDAQVCDGTRRHLIMVRRSDILPTALCSTLPMQHMRSQ